MQLVSPVTLHYFWKHVDKRDPRECWPWVGAKNVYGYGQMRTNEYTWSAHRLAYYIQTGVDPATQCVCHSCDNPACVNIAHLFLGTKADNNRDRHKKGRDIMPTNRARGFGSHPRAKLTDDEVRTIRDMGPWNSGSLIALHFGVSKNTIHAILRGETYRHVSRGHDFGDTSNPPKE